MTRCLVTGIAGFIGSSIAEALIGRGYKVRGVDNLDAGKYSNVLSLGSEVDFVRGDIRDHELMARLCKDVDFVFHQAAVNSIQHSVEDPVGSFDINVNGTECVIGAARSAGVRRILFASTAAIYGDAVVLPSSELDRCRPISPYAAQKLHSEMLLQQAWQSGGIEAVSLRYFNVFGPRQYADASNAGAVARLIKPTLHPKSSQHIVIHGDGSQTRDFVYIDDVVKANLAAMDGASREIAGGTFNVGSGCRHSVLETAQLIAALTSYKGPFHYAARQQGDAQHSVADMQQAQRYLGLGPATSFREGLSQTIAWMRAHTRSDAFPTKAAKQSLRQPPWAALSDRKTLRPVVLY